MEALVYVVKHSFMVVSDMKLHLYFVGFLCISSMKISKSDQKKSTCNASA